MKSALPQRSVLGLLLLNLYVSSVEDLLQSHGLTGLIYADDTKIFISIRARLNEGFGKIRMIEQMEILG